MKRSEMIQVLRYQIFHLIHLEKSGRLNSNEIDIEASRILKEIEELGMLPPQLMSGGEEPNQAYFTNEWEPETRLNKE